MRRCCAPAPVPAIGRTAASTGRSANARIDRRDRLRNVRPPSRRPSLLDRLWWNRSPTQRVVLGSLLAVIAGALLLWSPVTHNAGQGAGFLTSLLAATSALCTTGLATVNVARVWNPFGLLVLMVLVQIGGLGLLTIGFWFSLLSRRGDSLRQRLGAAEQLGVQTFADVLVIARRIVALSFAVEGVGALVMLPAFAREEGLARGLLYAVLHAVMAFNNSGFAVYDDGLARFAGNVPVNVALAGLVVLGGLGFLVLDDVRRPRRRWRTLTKVALVSASVLIFGGAALLTALEWRGAFGALPAWERIVAGVFHSVSARSAGFNTVDLAAFSPASLLVLMVLMFVGTSPNSTGGGIKTTTAAVLLAHTLAVVRGRADAELFRRRVATATLLRAVAVVTLALLAVSLGTFALVLTDGRLPTLHLAFEAVSAFATAGLSVNTTPQLSAGGMVVVTVLMFLGRVGLLTLLVALGRRAVSPVRRPEEDSLLVG